APTTPPTPGQILRATGPDTWTWQTVASGDGGGVVLPAEIVTTVNGETGDVVIDPPPLATATQSGLISAQLFALLTGQNATNGQALQIIGGIPTWGDLTVFATPIQWQKLTANATLETDKRYFVKGGSEFTLPATVSGSIEISNQTTTTVTIIAAGTARINGIATDNLVEISQQERVKIKPGKSAKLIADGGNWESQDCDNSFLRFTYAGSPAVGNPQNPLGARGILDYFGRLQAINAGVSGWQNPTTGAATVTAAASAIESGSVAQLSDQVAGGQTIYTNNAIGSWFGWRFPVQVRFTGFIFQTNAGLAAHLPRSWLIRVGTLPALVVGQSVSTLTVVDTRSDQTNITQPNTYYGPYYFTRTQGNTVVWQNNGMTSSNNNYTMGQEFEFFGDID
ncbi:hypothetical protein AMR42_11880, partial [Limnothrix sp. PR1529]|uniref:hypothetical protein n=1 Tax=Limnothrix sp. PR1529 TaxID=1704291 RepID=UPI000C3CEC44